MIVLPGQILKVFGDGGSNQHFAIYLGTALVGFATINWLYSNASNQQILKPAIYGNLASLLPAVVIDGVAVAKNNVSSSIWLILILHIVFGVAFLYCLRVIIDAERLQA